MQEQKYHGLPCGMSVKTLWVNSSIACFWIKQVCAKKGGTGLGGGIYDEEWEFFYQINATKLHEMPLIPAPVAISLVDYAIRFAWLLAIC